MPYSNSLDQWSPPAPIDADSVPFRLDNDRIRLFAHAQPAPIRPSNSDAYEPPVPSFAPSSRHLFSSPGDGTTIEHQPLVTPASRISPAHRPIILANSPMINPPEGRSGSRRKAFPHSADLLGSRSESSSQRSGRSDTPAGFSATSMSRMMVDEVDAGPHGIDAISMVTNGIRAGRSDDMAHSSLMRSPFRSLILPRPAHTVGYQSMAAQDDIANRPIAPLPRSRSDRLTSPGMPTGVRTRPSTTHPGSSRVYWSDFSSRPPTGSANPARAPAGAPTIPTSHRHASAPIPIRPGPAAQVAQAARPGTPPQDIMLAYGLTGPHQLPQAHMSNRIPTVSATSDSAASTATVPPPRPAPHWNAWPHPLEPSTADAITFSREGQVARDQRIMQHRRDMQTAFQRGELFAVGPHSSTMHRSSTPDTAPRPAHVNRLEQLDAMRASLERPWAIPRTTLESAPRPDPSLLSDYAESSTATNATHRPPPESPDPSEISRWNRHVQDAISRRIPAVRPTSPPLRRLRENASPYYRPRSITNPAWDGMSDWHPDETLAADWDSSPRAYGQPSQPERQLWGQVPGEPVRGRSFFRGESATDPFIRTPRTEGTAVGLMADLSTGHPQSSATQFLQQSHRIGTDRSAMLSPGRPTRFDSAWLNSHVAAYAPVDLDDPDGLSDSSSIDLPVGRCPNPRFRASMSHEQRIDLARLVGKMVVKYPHKLRKRAAEETLKKQAWGEVAEEGMEKDAFCSVCHDEYEDKTQVVVTPCKHMYHQSCMETWLQVPHMSSCPMCRRDLALLSTLGKMMPGGAECEAVPVWMAM